MLVSPESFLSTITVLAHQGGWDEILMVGVPVIVFAALLRVANKRAASLVSAEDLDTGEDNPDGTQDGRGDVQPHSKVHRPSNVDTGPGPGSDARGTRKGPL